MRSGTVGDYMYSVHVYMYGIYVYMYGNITSTTSNVLIAIAAAADVTVVCLFYTTFRVYSSGFRVVLRNETNAAILVCIKPCPNCGVLSGQHTFGPNNVSTHARILPSHRGMGPGALPILALLRKRSYNITIHTQYKNSKSGAQHASIRTHRPEQAST